MRIPEWFSAARTGLSPLLKSVNQTKKVYVAMSSGVDSSIVAAGLARLLGPENVHGVYMSNWQSGSKCVERDWATVQQVCDQISINRHRVDFEKEYWINVFERMVQEYARGITPNPDVSCNREIKFGALLEHLNQYTKDAHPFYVATGHYAGVMHLDAGTALCRAADRSKDQSYYLATVARKNLERVIFPLAETTKVQVRQLANDLDLVTAQKPDSQGLCFVEQNEKGFHKFLEKYIQPVPGEFITQQGAVLGTHPGIHSHTIGQRARVSTPQSDPKYAGKWFVSAKDFNKNRLVIVPGRDNPALYQRTVVCREFEWCGAEPSDPKTLQVQYRSLQEPANVESIQYEGDLVRVTLTEERRAIAPGQYLVFYDGPVVAGHGIIAEAF